LAEALQVAKSVQPESDDDGFKELAEELAHAGQVDDAVTIVDRMAGNVAPWNAEGLEKLADGLADAGQSDDALNILQRIPDQVNRAMEMITFVQDRKDEDPVKARAVAMLLKLAPNIPDDNNWSSASLGEVASELDKAGDPRVLSVLQSIRRQDYRVNGLVAHLTSLAQRGRIEEAHALMKDPLLAHQGNNMDLAVLIAGLPAKPDVPDPQGLATAMLVNAESDARRDRFFTAQRVGEVAERWARLGNVERCVAILDSTPDEFYRDMIYEPMKDSIRILLKGGKRKETQDAVARMKSNFRRSLAWTALAVQAGDPQAQRTLLLRAENDALQVLSDDDRSFAYSTTAQVWVSQHQYKHAVELGEKARSFDRVSVYQAVLDEDAQRRLKRSIPQRSRN
jgi:tetratricopeptide (TPR) repeat protein